MICPGTSHSSASALDFSPDEKSPAKEASKKTEPKVNSGSVFDNGF